MVSDFLSELKGKSFSFIFFKTAIVHLFSQFVLLGIKMETWETVIQNPSIMMSLGPEPWSQFQSVLGYGLRSASMLACPVEKVP